MDKQKLILTLAETQEDQMLLARVWDRFSAGTRKNIPAATCFLSGREQLLVRQLLLQGGWEDPVFFGGVSGAERQICVYVPDYYEPEEYLTGDDGPVKALRVHYSAYDTLNHRDFLGSLMGQGIKREVLGDIFPGEDFCDVLVLRDMVDYLSQNLTHVGRAKVDTREIPLTQVQTPEQKIKIVKDTVASLRLDSVMASGFQLGRSKASGYITAGKTEVNHMTVLKPDAPVAQGDVISVRGLGKVRLAQVGGRTKKGRTALVLEKFI